MRAARLTGVIATVTLLSACAYPKTQPLKAWNLASGYRFPRTDAAEAAPAVAPSATLDERRRALERADKLFVVLTFSGGGTRAGAFAYGALRQLEHVRIHVSPEGDVVPCVDWQSAECKAIERSLLDEVDVISSVSGGSFTSAYYALNGKEIFDTESAFHKRFLFHNVQRQLLANAVYNPRGWAHLGSRVEIASRYYQKHIFGPKSFADLERRGRPFIIVNADDMSTGNRFEFTQDQFDLLCADLAPFPVARAVAASSAFPGLLNSMTIDSHNSGEGGVRGCGYAGPGSPEAGRTWVDIATEPGQKAFNRRRYRSALALNAYRDPKRKHLHLLDGGLADNVGLRTVLQAFGEDRPSAPSSATTELNVDTGRVFGGWSLHQLINDGRIRTLIVIAVNARTERTNSWDRRARGPSTLAVVGAARGTPMGSFSHETVDLLQAEFVQLADLLELLKRPVPEFHAFEVAFDDIDAEAERQYFLNLPTSFSLTHLQATCLIDRSAMILRRTASLNGVPDANGTMPTFEGILSGSLHARFEPLPLLGNPRDCTR